MDTSHTAMDTGDVAAACAACGLLAVTLLAGGSSQQTGAGLTVAASMGIPLLAWGAWRRAQAPLGTLPAAWLVFAALVVLLPLFQLVPVPVSYTHLTLPTKA